LVRKKLLEEILAPEAAETSKCEAVALIPERPQQEERRLVGVGH